MTSVTQRADGRGCGSPAAPALVGPDFTIRPVIASEKRDIFNWRNDDATLALTCHADPVNWTYHQRWFGDCLNSLKSDLLLCVRNSDEQEKIALVRFEMSADQSRAEIALEIQSGTSERSELAIMKLVLADFFARRKECEAIDARVNAADAAAVTLFELAGFVCLGAETGGVVHFVLPAPSH